MLGTAILVFFVVFFLLEERRQRRRAEWYREARKKLGFTPRYLEPWD